MNLREPYIMVGVPSQDIWASEFGMSLTMMMTWSMKNRVLARSRKERIDIINFRGSILPDLREKIVSHAQNAGATHLLFLDSDQTFPKDLIRRLLGYELPVVAANIPVKRTPSAPTARKKHPSYIGGEVLYSHEMDGLEEVWRVGTGVMLIDMEVFNVIEAPYFTMYWDSQAKQYRGEDWVFCEKLEKAGIPIYIDHTVSKKIGHCGMRIFSHDDIPTLNELRAKAEAAA